MRTGFYLIFYALVMGCAAVVSMETVGVQMELHKMELGNVR